jgi:DNA-directed RNA polymerase specialized sigma24 family protein
MAPPIDALLLKHPAKLTQEDARTLDLWMARPAGNWSSEERAAADQWAFERLGQLPGSQWGEQGRKLLVRYLVRFRAEQLGVVCARRAGSAAWGALVEAQARGGLADADRNQIWHAFRESLHDCKHDIIQDQLTYLHQRGFDSFDPAKASLAGFIRMTFSRAAAHHARHEISRRCPDKVPAERVDEEAGAALERSGPRAERIAIAGETLTRLHQLPPHYRKAIELALDPELSRDGAAERAGCSMGAFAIRLLRAKQELWRIITQDVEELES